MTEQDVQKAEAAGPAADLATDGRIEPTVSATPLSAQSEAALFAGEAASSAPASEPVAPAASPLAAAAESSSEAAQTGAPPRGWGRNGRLALLAATIALSAAIGSIVGSVGFATTERILSSRETPDAQLVETVRALKNDLALLRAQVKSTGDQVASLRSSVTTSSAAAHAQMAKLSEALERADKRTALSPSTEITGSVARVPVPSAPKPLAGWIVRRVYDGIALIEGRDGIIEAEAGDNLPGLGRIQEIKRQNGRWVVMTSRGVITSR